MRIIEDYDNLLEMRKMKFSRFNPSAALGRGRKGNTEGEKKKHSPPRLARVLGEYK